MLVLLYSILFQYNLNESSCSAMTGLKAIPILFVSSITDSMYTKLNIFLLKFGLKYLRGYISSIIGAG